jgi:8-oxo-dGTP diphosphatase
MATGGQRLVLRIALSRLSSAAMTTRDGNGWTRCGRGHRHWGRHGAAGLLLAATDQYGRSAPTQAGGGGPQDSRVAVLLQQRSWWGSYGGSWGPPGGARDSHESAVRAALREAIEECAIDPRPIRVHGVLTDDHGGWTYQTVLASAAAPLAAAPISEETREVAWVPVAKVDRLPLHPGFADQWPALRAALTPLTIIVDAANVMGSRPDGWWRDRAGAAQRLADEVERLALAGVASLPESVLVPALERWFPRFVVVLEGAAVVAARDRDRARGRSAGQPTALAEPQVRIVTAAGSGDDEIARLAADVAGPRLVVTADRELRARCETAGAFLAGPRWLLGLL